MVNLTHRVTVEKFKTKKRVLISGKNMASYAVSIIMLGISVLPSICLFSIVKARYTLQDTWTLGDWAFTVIRGILAAASALITWFLVYEVNSAPIVGEKEKYEVEGK